MNKNIRMNYISLWISILIMFFEGFMYLLTSKSMYFPLKIGYAVLSLVLIIHIGFNIITIIKANIKS